jgi:hypothetical protein
VLLIAALPTASEALLALAVFAPMSIASMAACTAGFSWAGDPAGAGPGRVDAGHAGARRLRYHLRMWYAGIL